MPGKVNLEVLINETLSGTLSPQELADPDSEFIQVNELKVHCKIKGTGQPLMVLLHGFAASTYF
jgi:hypothetical protein